MPSSDEEIPLIERGAQYKMELIESSSNSRKMVVKKVPIIYPSSPQNSPKRDRPTRRPQIQKFIVDLPANDASGLNEEQSNPSKNTEVEKSAEKPKRKSLDMKLKSNDISDMLNVDDGDDDIETFELSDDEDADEPRRTETKKKFEEKGRKTQMKDKDAMEEKGRKTPMKDKADMEEKGRKTPMKDKADMEEKGRKTPMKDKADKEEKGRKTPMKDKTDIEGKDKGKSRDIPPKLEAWLARIATMPLEKVDNKPSRWWENSAKKEEWVAQMESNSDSELSSTSIKMKITRKAEVHGSGCESPIAGTPRKTASSASKSAKRKLYRIGEAVDEAIIDVNMQIEETPQKGTSTSNSVSKSARRKLYSIEQTPEEKRRLLFHKLPSKEGCPVHATSLHNRLDTSSPRGSPRVKQCNLTKMTKHSIEDELMNEDCGEDSENDSLAVRSSRKQTSSNNDITKSAKRKLYKIDEVESGKHGQKKPIVLVEDCMSKVRTRQSSVVKSSNGKSSSRRGEQTPSKQATRKTKHNGGNESRRTPVSSNRNSKKTVMSDSDSSNESDGESSDESDRESSWEHGNFPVRRSSRKRKLVKISSYNSGSDSNASSSSKCSIHLRCRQKRESISSDDEVVGRSERQRTPSSKQSSSNVAVKDRKQDPGPKGRLLPSNESHQGSGSEVSAAFRRVILARHSPRDRKHIRSNEDNSENNSDPSESSKSLQHESICQSLNLQKSPKVVSGKEKLPLDRRGCGNEVLVTLRKNLVDKLESPIRCSPRMKETAKLSPYLRRNTSENSNSPVRRSVREKKSISYNLDKDENDSDSDDTAKSHDNQKRGHEFSSSNEDHDEAAISKKVYSKNLMGREKSLRNKENNKKSNSRVSSPSTDDESPARSSQRGRKPVKMNESNSSDSESNTKNLKRPDANDSIDSTTSPVRQSARKRKPPNRYSDDEEGSNSSSVVVSKRVQAPCAKRSGNEESRGARKVMGEQLASLHRGRPRRKNNDDTEGTKSPGSLKRKSAVSSSDDEDRARSRISQPKLQGTPSSKRVLSELRSNASPREKTLRNKENRRTPSKNYESPIRHSTRERKPVNFNESDSSDNDSNISRTKTQKTPDVKQRLNNNDVNGITTPSSRSARKQKPSKKYSDDDEEGTNLPSVISSRRVQTPQAKQLQADIYASPARQLRQKRTPAKQTSDDSDTDVLVSKVESPGTPRAAHLTPSNRKSLARRGLLTPTMPARDRTVSTPNTPQQEAMCRLHVSAVPKTLPCREKEFADIFRFIEGKILDKAGGCMYISGTPGTGKTATVREVMESLRQAVVRKDLPDFEFIEMNAMTLTEPRQAYVFILKALTGEKATAEEAQRVLEKMFTRSAKRKANKSIVLMVDELDILWTRREDVVYNLLDWPTKVGSRFIVLTIANTMDMPERMLKGRVTSRLGLTRLTFQPYTFKQLAQIVQSRLEGIQAFDSDAVQLVARKVASVSGDARRALDICRRATELAELDGPDVLVSISHVGVAVGEMLSSSKLQALRACSEIELLFLKAVMTEVERTGIEETRFFKVYKMLGALCVLDGLQVPNVSLALKACNSLGSIRLLLTEHSRSDIQQRLLLNVNPEDVRYTLKEMGG